MLKGVKTQRKETEKMTPTNMLDRFGAGSVGHNRIVRITYIVRDLYPKLYIDEMGERR
jgi:hypothetical protein